MDTCFGLSEIHCTELKHGKWNLSFQNISDALVKPSLAQVRMRETAYFMKILEMVDKEELKNLHCCEDWIKGKCTGCRTCRSAKALLTSELGLKIDVKKWDAWGCRNVTDAGIYKPDAERSSELTMKSDRN